MKKRKSKPANCIHKLRTCDALSALRILKQLRNEHENVGYECHDLLLGAYRYELEDGFVVVCWEDGWITEEAYEYID